MMVMMAIVELVKVHHRTHPRYEAIANDNRKCAVERYDTKKSSQNRLNALQWPRYILFFLLCVYEQRAYKCHSFYSLSLTAKVRMWFSSQCICNGRPWSIQDNIIHHLFVNEMVLIFSSNHIAFSTNLIWPYFCTIAVDIG